METMSFVSKVVFICWCLIGASAVALLVFATRQWWVAKKRSCVS